LSILALQNSGYTFPKSMSDRFINQVIATVALKTRHKDVRGEGVNHTREGFAHCLTRGMRCILKKEAFRYRSRWRQMNRLLVPESASTMAIIS
jgi:hypothetical protein